MGFWKRFPLTKPVKSINLYNMEMTKEITYFNKLAVDLNNEAFFSSGIYERTRENPNLGASYRCHPCNDSLDDYANQLSNKILSALRT